MFYSGCSKNIPVNWHNYEAEPKQQLAIQNVEGKKVVSAISCSALFIYLLVPSPWSEKARKKYVSMNRAIISILF